MVSFYELTGHRPQAPHWGERGEIPQEAVYHLVVPTPTLELLEQNIPRNRVIHSQHYLPVPEKRQNMKYILQLLKKETKKFQDEVSL